MEAQEIEDRHEYDAVQHEGKHNKHKPRDYSRLLRLDSLDDGLYAEHDCEHIEHCYQGSVEKHEDEGFSIVESNT